MMNRLALSILLAQAVSADLVAVGMEPRSTPHHPCPLHRRMQEAKVSCERDVVALCSGNNGMLRGFTFMPPPMETQSRGPISPLNIGAILDEMMDSAMHLAFEESQPTLFSRPVVPEEESESEENAPPPLTVVKLTNDHAMTEEDKAVEAFDNMLVSLFTKVVAEERSSQSNSKSSDVAEIVSVGGEAKNVEESIAEEEDKNPEDFDASVWTNAVLEHGHEILSREENAERDHVDLKRRRLQDEPKRAIRRRLAERLIEVPLDVLIFPEDRIVVFTGLPPPRKAMIGPIAFGLQIDTCLWDNLSTRSLSQACGSSLVNLQNARSEMIEDRDKVIGTLHAHALESAESARQAEDMSFILFLVSACVTIYWLCLRKACSRREESDPCVCCCCGMDSSQAGSLKVDDACCTCCKGTGVCGPGCTSCCGDSANGGKPCDCCDGKDCDMCSGGATMSRPLPGYPGSRRTVAKPQIQGAAYTGIPASEWVVYSSPPCASYSNKTEQDTPCAPKVASEWVVYSSPPCASYSNKTEQAKDDKKEEERTMKYQIV